MRSCKLSNLIKKSLTRVQFNQIKTFSCHSRTFFWFPRQRLSCAGNARHRNGDECAATLPKAKGSNGLQRSSTDRTWETIWSSKVRRNALKKIEFYWKYFCTNIQVSFNTGTSGTRIRIGTVGNTSQNMVSGASTFKWIFSQPIKLFFLPTPESKDEAQETTSKKGRSNFQQWPG